MIKIIIEKKAKYTICALVIILIGFIAINSFSSSSFTPSFYDSLYQIAKSDSDFTSVDANKNGIIDESETASMVRIENIKKMPGACNAGSLLKGFDSYGNPICVSADFFCSFDETQKKNTCWVTSGEIGGQVQ